MISTPNQTYIAELCGCFTTELKMRNFTTTNPSNVANYSQYRVGVSTTTLNILFSSLAVTFNSILILVLIRDPFREFRSASTVFVANLAVADLFTGIFTMLKSVLFCLEIQLSNIALIYSYHASAYTMQCSIFTVLLITMERLLAVMNPTKFKTLLTKSRCFLLSLATWLLPFLDLTFIVLIAAHTLKIYLLYSLINLLAICLVVLGYFHLYKLLKRKRQEIVRYAVPETEENSKNGNSAPSLRRRQRTFAENKRLVNTFLMVTAVLVISMVPITLVYMVLALCSIDCSIMAWYIAVKYEPFVMLNFIANPVIYAFRLPQYRKAFWTVLKCARHTTTVSPMAT